MSFWENGLKAKVMSTELIIEANVSKKILFEALALVKEFELKYSAYKDDSLLCKINRLSGKEKVQCSQKELEIFHKAKGIAEKSFGLFDPTIGALTQGLYGFGKASAKIPTKKELASRQKLVNYKDIVLDAKSIYLKQVGMKLDLGGIGKGYIADEIFSFLESRGATKILISVGGEILSSGKEYSVAIKNPFTEGNSAIITTTKESLSISTSGDYERFIGSKEHHHILESSSAKQKHYYSSITLLKSGVDATQLDGVATIAFNSPLEDLSSVALKFGVAIIAITPKKQIVFENFQDIELKSFEIYPF